MWLQEKNGERELDGWKVGGNTKLRVTEWMIGCGLTWNIGDAACVLSHIWYYMYYVLCGVVWNMSCGVLSFRIRFSSLVHVSGSASASAVLVLDLSPYDSDQSG